MESHTLLTFTLAPASMPGKLSLRALPIADIGDGVWEAFAAAVAKETTVVGYPAAAFAARWRAGFTAIALAEGMIVSHISFVPVLHGRTRQQLSMSLAVSLPQVDVYEGTTAWTHPNWRGKGVYQQLRKALIDRFNVDAHLLVGVTVGLGASPVLAKFNSRILAWREIPYLSSLIAVPQNGFEAHSEHVWHIPPTTRLYQGPPMTFERRTDHDWDHFSHFWVANVPLAHALETDLQATFGGDLARWRAAIVDVFTAESNAAWKLTFFQEPNP